MDFRNGGQSGLRKVGPMQLKKRVGDAPRSFSANSCRNVMRSSRF
jgi:hypothetical protein